MAESIEFFFSQPLWLTIPLIATYLGLLGYVVYILYHYRKHS